MTRTNNLAFIFFIVVLIFITTIYAEVCLIDDRQMLRDIASVPKTDLFSIFFPASHGGFYYRPVIAVSFFADRFIHGLNPVFMHLENIFLHAFNVMLVYLIATKLLTREIATISSTRFTPILSALLFAVHPISTESVAWISGRTDLLSTFFVLLSCYCLVMYRSLQRQKPSPLSLWLLIALSVIFLLLGFLAKEPAIGFIPAMAFLLFGSNEFVPAKSEKIHYSQFIIFLIFNTAGLLTALIYYEFMAVLVIAALYGLVVFFYYRIGSRSSLNEIYTYLASVIASVLGIVAVFWGVRSAVFASQSSHIARTLKLLFLDINQTVAVFLKAYGFYVKKFFLPLPLNFVIRDVDVMYTFVGIVILFVAVWMIVNRRRADMFALTGLCMIAPVLPLTFDSIAWTPYAERYVYPAAPFFILAGTMYVSAILPGLQTAAKRVTATVLLAVILIMAYSTYQRNLVWQTNITLFGDSVSKTPAYRQLRGLYMVALYEKARYEEAAEQYRIAEKLPTILLKEDYYGLFYAQILLKQHKYTEAEKVLNTYLSAAKITNHEVYVAALELESNRLMKASSPEQKLKIIKTMTAYQRELAKLSKAPIDLYTLGQLYLLLDDRKAARESFAQAYQGSPPNSHYREAARKLAERL